MAEKWYNLTPEQTAARLSSDLERGLEPKQAAQRLRREGKNTVYRVERPMFSTLVWDVLRDPCAYILLISAVLAWIFNEAVGAPLIILISVVNALVVLSAYLKSRSVIADAHEHTVPTATVIRGGKQYLIKQTRLCRGDIIVLGKGDVVPCDARIISSKELYTIEVALTGKPGRVKKTPALIHANNLDPTKQSDMVFATTIVAGGSAKAIVCETGDDTLAAYLGKTVDTREDKVSLGILSSLKRRCAGWSFVMLTMVFVLTLVDFILGFSGRSVFNIFVTGLSVAAAGMCEYYLVFGYIIIGCGLYGMLRRGKNEGSGAVVKNIRDIDKLSRITTLILPRNGAFMAGSIRLRHLWCDGTLHGVGERNLNRSCKYLISAAFDSTVYPEKDYEKVYNRFKARDVLPEERAILSLAVESSVFDGPAYMGSHIPKIRKSDSEVLRSLVMVNGKNILNIRGRSEDILHMCTRYRSGEGTKLIKNENNRIRHIISELDEKGMYALCIATKVTDDIDDNEGFVFEGFLAINKIKLAGAEKNVKRIRDAGIRIIMLTDTTSNDTRNYASALGITDNDDMILSGAALKTMSETEFCFSIGNYTLYEGINDHRKALLVKQLQQNGEVVGYFGYSFEDISIIKDADIGFSCGITLTRGNSHIDLGAENSPVFIHERDEKGLGSEALKQVCDVIVSPADSNRGGFNAIAESIARSRQAFFSLASAVRYLLASQCARLLLFLYSAIVPVTLRVFGGDGLSAVQILLLGLCVDLAVVMAFAFRSSSRRLVEREAETKRGYFSGNLRSVIIGTVWAISAVAAPVILRLCSVLVDNRAMSCMIFLGFIAAQLVCALESSATGSIFTSLNISIPRLIAVFAAMTAFIFLCSYTEMFGCCRLTALQWCGVVLQPLVVLGVYEISKLIKKEKKNDNDT